MKPFAFALQFLSGSENERWGLFVDGMRLGSFSKRDAEERAFLINAAFEARLKEEMEKFRERAEKSIADACIDCRGSGTVTEDGHGCDGDDAKCFKICPVPIQRQCGYCGRWVNAIRALPLFETEEKP